MLKLLCAGAPACLTVTLLDGLVLARSAFHHSMNYRSVVVLGTAQRDRGARRRSAGRSTRSWSTSLPGRLAHVRGAVGAGAARDPRGRASRSTRRRPSCAPDRPRTTSPTTRSRSGPASCRCGSRRSRRCPIRASTPGIPLPAHVSRLAAAATGRPASVLAAPAAAGRRGVRRRARSPTSGCCSTAASRRCAASCPTARPLRRTSCWSATRPRRCGLARVEIQPRPPVEAGPRGEVVLDLTALGGYERDRPLLPAGGASRTGWWTSRASTLDRHRRGAGPARERAALPFWPARAPLPPPPESRARPSGVPRPRWRRSCATSRWPSPSRTRSRRGAARAATRACSSRSSRPSRASGRWCSATRRSPRSSRSAAWRWARARCALSRAGSSGASCASPSS